MRIRSTLKRSGGVDIKLKDRIISLIKIVGILIGGYMGCYLLFLFFDLGINGFLMDWFDAKFLSTSYMLDPDTGQGMYVRDLDIGGFKIFMFWVLVFVVCVWLAALYLVSHYKLGKLQKASMTEIGNGIQKYMLRDVDISDIFSGKYPEISAQMAEIKSRVQRNEQALKDEAQKKNDLITYLAHDLKTPLTSVIGYLSLLDEAPDMPAEQKAKYVHITLDKALRLEKLINEFFEITRYNLQQIILEKETIDLSYMLIQMTDEFYPLLAANGNRIELHAGEQLSVYGDSEKLARVFNNILKNAIAYSYPETDIQVRAEKTGDNVVIAVSNHGATIPTHKLDMVFEKFFRLDEARRTNTGGAGLGLAIAKDIVELHGGTITAESADEITTFCVILPA